MDFGRNKTTIEVIKEGSFGGTYFINIYSRVNDKFYNNIWEKFKELKRLTKNTIAVINMMSVSINML